MHRAANAVLATLLLLLLLLVVVVLLVLAGRQHQHLHCGCAYQDSSESSADIPVGREWCLWPVWWLHAGMRVGACGF
jgi:hypothetical protein